MRFLGGLLLAILICSSCANWRRSIPPQQTLFTLAERQLITDGTADQPMRVYKLTNESDSILLRKQSIPVVPDTTDALLMTFIDRLYATVRDSMSMGVGIAAPQVGILKNIIWVQRFDKPDFPFEVYLNPIIKQYSTKKQVCREGCLSIPDRSDTLSSRAYAILLQYDDVRGKQHVELVEDFTAVIFQHEIDHLNGILYTDHLEKERKL